jgi:hypothetical protein
VLVGVCNMAYRSLGLYVEQIPVLGEEASEA